MPTTAVALYEALRTMQHAPGAQMPAHDAHAAVAKPAAVHAASASHRLWQAVALAACTGVPHAPAATSVSGSGALHV